MRNMRLEGTSLPFAGVNVACLSAHDEGTEFFVFRRVEIACAGGGARHGGGRKELAQRYADFAVEVVAVFGTQFGFDVLAFPRGGQHGGVTATEVVIGIGDFAVFGNKFDTETRFDAVVVAYAPDAAGQGAFFKVLGGRAVVGRVGRPVLAFAVARLADTGGKGGFVFVHVPNDGADVAFVEEVVVVVADTSAETVFGIVADTGFEFVAFDFGNVDFDGHAVALEAVEVGLNGCAGVMSVLFERLLEVEQEVEIVGCAGFETCQAGNDVFGINGGCR